MKLVPSKGQFIVGLVVFAVGMYIYNKVPTVRKTLGAAA